MLVTRSPRQASALADALRARGADVVLIAAIDIAPPASFAELDAVVGDLLAGQPGPAGWLVFTSGNGVDAFFSRWELQAPGRGKPAGLRVAAVGAATARALGERGWAVDVVPARAVAEALAEALEPFAREAGAPGRFRLIRAERGREVLPECLRAAGADVQEVTAYRTVIPEGSVAALAELWGAGGAGVDAVTFTSSSSVWNLLELCRAAGVGFPRGVVKASIGPVTTATLAEAGLAAEVQAEAASVESLANAVSLKLHLKESA